MASRSGRSSSFSSRRYFWRPAMAAMTHFLFFASSFLTTKKRAQGMRRISIALLLASIALLPLGAQAQGNYVYVNNQAAANTVSAYSVSAAGSLTQLPGSPFSTGGAGANVVCYGLNRIALSQADNLLFVANTGDRTISVFQVNPSNGQLTRAAGSPVPSGLTLDSCKGDTLAAIESETAGNW